jgi:outer membrane protein OmpA-like peptidoglycan-associated protein
VLPPLPDDVDTVDVRLGEGLLLGVPVGEGALAPAVDAPSVPLGDGWPALPDVATARDPAAQVRPLVRNVEEPERGLRTQERADEVAESLATDVLFAVDSAELDPAAQAVLGEVAARLRERATGTVQVVGHTDGTGETAYNQQLSQARADAVAQVLRAAAPGLALEASGRGESEPVADDSTEEGRALNRRVTVVYGLREDA